jgi:hypothetical protein
MDWIVTGYYCAHHWTKDERAKNDSSRAKPLFSFFFSLFSRDETIVYGIGVQNEWRSNL